LDVAVLDESDFDFVFDEPADGEDDESLDELDELDDESPSFADSFFAESFFGASPAAPPVPLP
jgi:hypothetical protein